MRFSFDGDDVVFHATGAGRPWNGWLCPIVDQVTLRAVIARLGEISEDRVAEFSVNASGAVTVTELEVLDGGSAYSVAATQTYYPNLNGRYLLNMGLTLTEV